jgi:C1A family cysteine protease
MMRRNRNFGWIPDLPDHRDYAFATPLRVAAALPKKVDLRAKCPPVVNQGNLGSCTANAIANAHLFEQMKQGIAARFLPSRLFIYYNERAIEGTINSDSGAMIRDGIKSVSKQGACREKLWPYVISKFTRKPSAAAVKEALKHQALSYLRISQNLAQMKGCLASGFPFVFGFTVYESFESKTVAKSGVVPMPASDEGVVGGHAVLATGYDDAKQRFIVMNSWGAGWGMKGYFTIPYAYLSDPDLSADFWTIRLVEV